MNYYRYYLIRNMKTKEMEYVHATRHRTTWGEWVESISQAEFETYKEFGIPAITSRNLKEL